MDILFGYIAGLLTLINPCVLPLLPIVIVTALRNDPRGPLALAAGLSVAFVTLGVGISAVGPTLGIDEETIAKIAALVMIAFGFVLLVPRLSESFVTVSAGLASSADHKIGEQQNDGLSGQFFTGVLLGAVWSPCIGPTLGGAIALAAAGENLLWATAIMMAFAAGVSTLIIALAYGTQDILRKRQAALRNIAGKVKPITGVALVLVGLAIFFDVHKILDAVLLDVLPTWLTDLSVAL
ncbi:MAG: cytochrome c biogenesis CcdA family protein [Pseudomonadota bacterium]